MPWPGAIGRAYTAQSTARPCAFINGVCGKAFVFSFLCEAILPPLVPSVRLKLCSYPRVCLLHPYLGLRRRAQRVRGGGAPATVIYR